MTKRKKQETLMDAAKETVGLGILSGAGMYGVSRIGAMAGPHAAPVTGAVGAGLAITNIGRMAKTGQTIAHTMTPQRRKGTKEDKLLKKIWG